MTISPTNITRLANLTSLALVVVLAWQLAGWGWRLFAPASPSIEAVAVQPVDRSLARTLLGDPGAAEPAASNTAATTSGIRLKGVFAVDGKTLSAAIVNIGGRDLSVRNGEAISEGVKLVEVAPGQIVVSRGGVRETIPMERMSAANTSVGGNVAGAGKAAAAPQANFRLNVASQSRNSYSLSRSELNNVLQDPNQINFLGNIAPAAGGGVQVKDAPSGSLAQKLGLQVGDTITTINGQPVTGPGDLARFYGQFGSTNSIRAEIKRGGAPLLLTYAINP
jgi:type II secretory pathway component PulC